jgi:hypothetical protein
MRVPMLAWNQRKVGQLTPSEVWLFIAGRVLAAFGLGMLAVIYLPDSSVAAWPSLVLGLVILAIAFKGFRRAPKPPVSG